MQFGTRRCKGVKRKWLPEPNPKKVEMPRKANLMNVFERAKELYFHEECDVHDMQLAADSSGMMKPGGPLRSILMIITISQVGIKCIKCSDEKV